MTVFGNMEQLSWYGEVSKHFGGYRQLPKVRIQFSVYVHAGWVFQKNL